MPLVKPEKKELFLNIAITPTMDEKIRAFAEAHEVNRSVAARYILEQFFKDNPEAGLPKNINDFDFIGVTS